MPPSSTEAKECGQNEEVLQTKLVRFISNANILKICFVFHPDQIISEDYDCLGMDSCFLCQYRECTSSQTQLDEISSNNFQSFLYGMGCHKVDYTYEIWYSLTTVRRKIDRLMCKPTLGQGMSFCPAKSSAFHVSSHLLPYIVTYLKGKGCMVVHSYKRKNQTPWICFGLAYESKQIKKDMGRYSFETNKEFCG